MIPWMIITAAEMLAHGLPPIEISCSGAVDISRFIDAQTPLYYSGPPGGPDHLFVQVVQHAPGDAPFSLESEVRKHDRAGQNFVLGEAGEIEVAGIKRPVLSWSIKVTPWLDARATTYVAVPEWHATLVITFSAWRDAAHAITTHPLQKLILTTLSIKTMP